MLHQKSIRMNRQARSLKHLPRVFTGNQTQSPMMSLMILRCCGTEDHERELSLISQSAAAALDHQTIAHVVL